MRRNPKIQYEDSDRDHQEITLEFKESYDESCLWIDARIKSALKYLEKNDLENARKSVLSAIMSTYRLCGLIDGLSIVDEKFIPEEDVEINRAIRMEKIKLYRREIEILVFETGILQ